LFLKGLTPSGSLSGSGRNGPGRASSTWNVSLDAVRSAATYWQRHGWLAADFSRMLARRRPRPDRGRALSRGEVDQLLARKDIGLYERTLWRMRGPTDLP
jgi:hypothetical protein